MWHPALIKQTQAYPEIQSTFEKSACWQADEGNDNTSAPLIVVPNISAAELDSATIMSWTANCDALVVEEVSDRQQIIDRAAATSGELLDWQKSVSADLAADFYALAYAYLQTMMLTLKLRYSTNLDVPGFQDNVIAAAEAAVAGNDEEASDKLFACFDALLEEKNCYYPVEPQLCELLLTHPNTLGNALTKQLESSDSPISVLISGQDARKLAEKNQPAVATIKQRAEAKTLSIIGGLEAELDENLVCGETVVNQISIGRESLKQVFGQPPNVFARRSFGLNPTTPGILNSFGYAGAIHANFSGGTIPSMGSGTMRWTGDDEEHVLGISEPPMDAADSGTFLELGMVLGEMIDSAHSATALLTHWPNQSCQSLSDLKRIAKFVPLFGDFVTIDLLFDEAYDPGYGHTFTADEYESPHLKDAIKTQQKNPISRYVDYWQRIETLESVRRIALLATFEHDLEQSAVTPVLQRTDELQTEVEAATRAKAPLPSPAAVDEKIQALLVDVTRLLEPTTGKQNSANVPKPSTVKHFVNCHSTKQRFEVKPPAELSLPAGSVKEKAPVCFAVNRPTSVGGDEPASWILDLPAFSKTAIDFSHVEKGNLYQKDPPLCSGLLLQNEYFKVQLNEKSGGIRSIQQHSGKTNLAGQQLAIRLPQNHPSKMLYGDMVADSIETIENETLSAAIKSTGRLVAGDLELARFEQTVRVVRGLGRVEVNVKVEPLEPLTASSEHYICSRLAWRTESARLFANVLDSRSQVASQWFHATKFVTVNEPGSPSVSLLTGGLPFHRRANRRMLDSVLMLSNESQTQFSFAIDIDQPYPAAAAASRLAPVIQCPVSDRKPESAKSNESAQPRSDWLFHFNRKNILVTYAVPIFDSQGKCSGVSFRLKETESRSAQLVISTFKALRSAEIVKFNGELFSTLPLDEADNRKVSLAVDSLSFLQVNLYF